MSLGGCPIWRCLRWDDSLRIRELITVAFRSAKEACFRGAKGNSPEVILSPILSTNTDTPYCGGAALKKGYKMAEEQLPQIGGTGFEGLKKTNDYGADYWSARDLQPLLGYSQWRRFESAIKKAITSCENSGNDPDHHFASAGKMVGIGSEASREVPDYQLSRFACYLIAQNGDPRKPEIANAQKYFAIQTRRQELTDQLAVDVERLRLELRKQTSEEFRALSGAARQAGVQSRMFGIFHDAGYKGLYGGLNADAIKARKTGAQRGTAKDSWRVASGLSDA